MFGILADVLGTNPQDRLNNQWAAVDPAAFKSAYTSQAMGDIRRRNAYDITGTGSFQQLHQLSQGIDPGAIATMRAQQGEALRGQMALANSGRNREAAMRAALAGAAGAQAQIGAATAAAGAQNRLGAMTTMLGAQNANLQANQAAETQRRSQLLQGAEIDQQALLEAERARTSRFGVAAGVPTAGEAGAGLVLGGIQSFAGGR